MNTDRSGAARPNAAVPPVFWSRSRSRPTDHGSRITVAGTFDQLGECGGNAVSKVLSLDDLIERIDLDAIRRDDPFFVLA